MSRDDTAAGATNGIAHAVPDNKPTPYSVLNGAGPFNISAGRLAKWANFSADVAVDEDFVTTLT